MKISPSELESNLIQFTGTTKYYRLLATFAVTDGVKYLMDHADCYWLGQLYGVHLKDTEFNLHPFTILNMVRKGQGAMITIEDGNGGVLSQQAVNWTDFPLASITLYASWSGDYWVGMLPSEY